MRKSVGIDSILSFPEFDNIIPCVYSYLAFGNLLIKISDNYPESIVSMIAERQKFQVIINQKTYDVELHENFSFSILLKNE